MLLLESNDQYQTRIRAELERNILRADIVYSETKRVLDEVTMAVHRHMMYFAEKGQVFRYPKLLRDIRALQDLHSKKKETLAHILRLVREKK